MKLREIGECSFRARGRGRGKITMKLQARGGDTAIPRLRREPKARQLPTVTTKTARNRLVDLFSVFGRVERLKWDEGNVMVVYSHPSEAFEATKNLNGIGSGGIRLSVSSLVLVEPYIDGSELNDSLSGSRPGSGEQKSVPTNEVMGPGRTSSFSEEPTGVESSQEGHDVLTGMDGERLATRLEEVVFRVVSSAMLANVLLKTEVTKSDLPPTGLEENDTAIPRLRREPKARQLPTVTTKTARDRLVDLFSLFGRVERLKWDEGSVMVGYSHPSEAFEATKNLNGIGSGGIRLSVSSLVLVEPYIDGSELNDSLSGSRPGSGEQKSVPTNEVMEPGRTSSFSEEPTEVESSQEGHDVLTGMDGERLATRLEEVVFRVVSSAMLANGLLKTEVTKSDLPPTGLEENDGLLSTEQEKEDPFSKELEEDYFSSELGDDDLHSPELDDYLSSSDLDDDDPPSLELKEDFLH